METNLLFYAFPQITQINTINMTVTGRSAGHQSIGSNTRALDNSLSGVAAPQEAFMFAHSQISLATLVITAKA